MEMICPKCGSSSTYKSKKFSAWVCEDCGEKFTETVVASRKWNDDLENADYWNDEFISGAPISLAVSYKKLKEYVVNGNIGCTLFLIRDVFELMIKIPVVIILDGVYSTLETTNDMQKFLAEHPKFKALYANSMQILTTGKWWECVRLGAGLIREFGKNNLFSGENDLVYLDTALYLEKIYKMFWFQIPGQAKVNMVSWRNRAVGHSCLASNPEENYAEIPYILKMLKQVCDVSIPYYQKVSLADANHNILNGTNSAACDDKIFVAYLGGEKRLYTQIHSFVAGKIENLAYYDGYEKGKAYLLNYADGDRYKDIHLSKYIEEMSSSSEAIYFSENSIDADNLETADIQQLETELREEDKVVTIPYLYRWVINSTEAVDRGIFLLQAERGMGKSTFCNTINQLSDSENVLWYSEQINEWADFTEKSAIRVWHFNSTYFGRKDVYLPGIRDALLTLTTGHFENKKWIEANRLIGRLTSMWDSLEDSESDLRHIYFAEAMNATFEEYLARTDKERLILVLDGIDELSDPETLMSYIPNPSELSENIYIILVTRTDNELPESFKSKEILGKRAYNASLTFKRTNIIVKVGEQTVEKQDNNDYYCEAVDQYIWGSFGESSSENRGNLAKRFDNRFSELAAYKALCKMNAVFAENEGNDLLETFVDTLRKNSPEFYCKKVEMILNALAWSGSSLTIRELAYLSGEQYVTYRFIGMLHDLKAFIRVVRTDRGNCYEFSHSEWEHSVKRKYPYGAIYFRQLCNRLLEEIAQEGERDFFEEENQGELWILGNLLRLYNNSYEDLKQNWFEEVKIDTVSDIWVKVLQKLSRGSKINVTSNLGMSILAVVVRVWVDYDIAVKNFYYDKHDGIKCSTSNSAESQLANVLQNALSINQTIKDAVSEVQDFYVAAGICNSVGKIFDKFVVRCSDEDMKKNYALLADACYRQAGELYNKEKNESRLSDILEMLYQSGRVCQLADIKDRAKTYYEAALKIILDYSQAENSRVMLCAARVCTRYALLLDDSIEQFDYYISAEKMLCDLIRSSCEAEYLDWRTWLYRLMAKWNEDKGNLEQAQLYWEAAFSDAEKLCDVRGTYEDQNDLKWAMEGLSDSYVFCEEWKKAVPFLCRLIAMDDWSIKYFQNLSKAYDGLEMYAEKNVIDNKLSSLEENKLEYANAYQEVLEIIKCVSNEDELKIPRGKIHLFETLQNKNHGFRYDPLKTLDEQGVMKRTKAIIAILFRDYWSYGKQKEKIMEKQERDRLEMKVELLQEILNTSCYSASFSPEAFIKSGRKSSVYNEVNWILSHLPRNITRCIPLSILSDIVDRRFSQYTKKLEMRKKNLYSEGTIPVVRYLIDTFVSDELIATVMKSVPADIDLSIIFDNPDYED